MLRSDCGGRCDCHRAQVWPDGETRHAYGTDATIGPLETPQSSIAADVGN